MKKGAKNFDFGIVKGLVNLLSNESSALTLNSNIGLPQTDRVF